MFRLLPTVHKLRLEISVVIIMNGMTNNSIQKY